MTNVKQQADNCLMLFKGNAIGTIERALKNLNTPVKKELCSRFNCNEAELASRIASS